MAARLDKGLWLEYFRLNPDWNWGTTGNIAIPLPPPLGGVIPLPYTPTGKMPKPGPQLAPKIFPQILDFKKSTPIRIPSQSQQP